MTRTTTTGSCAGFTLIEMMAVMLIISMMASLVVAMVPGTGRGKLKALTLETAALLRRERLAAVLTGQSRFISLDGPARTLVGQSGAIEIPRDVMVDVTGVDERWSGRRAVVRFEPDGASTGAVLKFSWENVRYEVNVNWYNGRVAVDVP
ncbi:prepilin-type N-terminal cleavage/methylation domain-containing protein [Bradyrhizobium sp. WSM 1704]|uniref:prepilin-type N-terminal cleavage/methylation domain-containing protein n=1 Tax=Bradyrhizobium semiaridum TaxID=2821404 RepID=UPI001CE36A6F|nr:prepilin-type N-terminal cleavage/methylation domain-containing protein [Bradyrhizobium semiaridum]MCA6120305.1 prepilin-type N-terminal cleavage/methylation domain-containing protein [Bradyrhizobium semiaridum]